MLLRIERGKGGRYRNAMLPEGLLLLPREWWRAGQQQGKRKMAFPIVQTMATAVGHRTLSDAYRRLKLSQVEVSRVLGADRKSRSNTT